MAALVGLTPAYFSKYFKRITESNFTQYLNNVRLEHALQDMIYDNLSVTDAALENGFANVKSFITFCKKVYGCTPMHYKKQFSI
ncbi:MAG TPA: helix-turn-helix transcriptional regulator [Candidatus Scatovicinus merdipullorum]|nr:helix-turn-helix transcriptional regulator [Candidatus Scatovicinus merdipullorum]